MTVHGGNVVADIETIRQYSASMNRVTEWKSAFLNNYGVAFSNVKDSTLERELIVTMNSRAIVKCTRAWNDPKKALARQAIISNADQILEAWVNSEEHLFQQNSRTEKLYSEIQTLFDSCQF